MICEILFNVVSKVKEDIAQLIYSLGMAFLKYGQPVFTRSKSASKTVCQLFSKLTKKRHQNDVNNVVLVSLLFTLNRFHTL